MFTHARDGSEPSCECYRHARATMIKNVFYKDRSGWPFSVGEFYPRLPPAHLF